MAAEQHTTSLLIPVDHQVVHGVSVHTVDARKIHAFLEVKTNFNDWITRRIQTYGFVQDIDFTVLTFEMGTITTKEYHVTLPMAKELAMVERTKKGKEARLYFIECERKRIEHTTEVSRGDLLVQMAEAYRVQEQRVVALEAADRRHQQQRMEDQATLILHLQQAQRAETKADLALEDARYLAVEEFVMKNGLLHQFPPTCHRSMSDWLKNFCQDYGLDIRKAPVYGKPWDDENSYPWQAFSAFLRYEQKRPRQITLVKEAMSD